MGVTNGPEPDMGALLDLGCGLYLLIHGAGYALDQAATIRARYPGARIVVRRPGGIGDSPASVVGQIAEVYPAYARLGIRDWIAWNEPDRPDEGGFTAEQVAAFAEAFEPLARAACPGIVLHFPAWWSEQRYQGDEPAKWVPVARRYDVADFHAYLSVEYVQAYLRFHSTHFPDNQWMCTEFNWGLGNPRPADYGDLLYRAYRACWEWDACIGLTPFIWRWPGSEPGGEALEIANDPDAQAGIRRAVAELAAPMRILDPIPADWLERNTVTNRERWEPIARQIAVDIDVDPDIFARQIEAESNWDPEAVSSSGAYGLGQLMPRWYAGVRDWPPETNLRAAAATMKANLSRWGGDYALALASYNGGPAAIQKWHDTYGPGWRAALRLYPDQWAEVAGYGGPAKAAEVALYLDKILGPAAEPQPDQPETIMTIVDRRGQLPTLTGNWPRLSYGARLLDGITHTAVHYTAAPASLTAAQIAAYQVSDAAAGQTGAGQPFPGIAYTLYIDEDGTVELCHDLTVRTWHSDAPGWNEYRIGICFGGSDRPNPAQLTGLARAHVWCERELGWELGLSGHRDGSQTRCPGDAWPQWRADLQAAIDRERQGMNPSEPAEFPPDLAEEKAAILTLMDHQWGLAEAIRAKGYTEIADDLQAGLVAVKNQLGEP